MRSNHIRSVQLVVPPETATLEEAGGGLHFGQVDCPFCTKPTVVVGPKRGLGLVWAGERCSHSEGAVAGHGLDITVLFRGVK